MYGMVVFRCKLFVTFFLKTLVWPSDYSTLSAFMNLVKNQILKPTHNVDVQVKVTEFDVSDFLIKSC